MLHVDIERIVAARLRHHRNVDRAGKAQIHAQHQLALGEFLFHRDRGVIRHRGFLRVWREFRTPRLGRNSYGAWDCRIESAGGLTLHSFTVTQFL
jgi:hypothetical protein